ncbi:hypothetical protein MW887_003540 [Aspergillus wentii]|nr:hypothetical protein MW887_003540 [Aspergillus wentii]
MYGSTDSNTLDTYSGTTNPLGILRIVGGVNLLENQYLEFRLGISAVSVTRWDVVYVSSAVPYKRGVHVDPADPANLVIEDVKLPEKWRHCYPLGR